MTLSRSDVLALDEKLAATVAAAREVVREGRELQKDLRLDMAEYRKLLKVGVEDTFDGIVTDYLDRLSKATDLGIESSMKKINDRFDEYTDILMKGMEPRAILDEIVGSLLGHATIELHKKSSLPYRREGQ